MPGSFHSRPVFTPSDHDPGNSRLAQLLHVPGPFVGRTKDLVAIWHGRMKAIAAMLFPFVVAAGLVWSVYLLNQKHEQFNLPFALVVA